MYGSDAPFRQALLCECGVEPLSGVVRFSHARHPDDPSCAALKGPVSLMRPVNDNRA
jgi:hypothetical protein